MACDQISVGSSCGLSSVDRLSPRLNRQGEATACRADPPTSIPGLVTGITAHDHCLRQDLPELISETEIGPNMQQLSTRGYGLCRLYRKLSVYGHSTISRESGDFSCPTQTSGRQYHQSMIIICLRSLHVRPLFVGLVGPRRQTSDVRRAE